jgi:hypothetical protein
MKRTLTITGIALALSTVFASRALAQVQWTDKGFVNVSFGAQPPSRDLTTDNTFDLYDQAAVLSTTQDVAGGMFFDISAGYKLWRNLAVGMGFSRVGSEADNLTVDAQIPDPDFTDSPRFVSASVGSASHSQLALNFSGTWMMPFTDKIDVGFQFGPTIFFVSQELPTGLTVSEPGPIITQLNVTSVDSAAVGLHFGADATYLITPRIGVGVLARFLWGSTDLDDSTSDSLTLGGFQLGAGVRVRF